MKKIWKSLCLGALAVASVFGFTGCGKEESKVSVDLDGDGKVSKWETIYQDKASSSRKIMSAEKVEISSLSQLKAIDGRAKNTAYILTRNIDCNGESLSINLGSSNYFYGNNHYISNYNLGEVKPSNEVVEGVEPTYHNGFMSYANSYNMRALFYNGAGVYDLRLFMGLDKITVNVDSSKNSFSVTNLLEIPVIDNVEVRGALEVSMNPTGEVIAQNMDLSLVTNQINNVSNIANFKNIEASGKINYLSAKTVEKEKNMKIGVVASSINANTTLTNANVEADISTAISLTGSAKSFDIGMICAQNEGVIATAQATGSINAQGQGRTAFRIGGITGSNNVLGATRIGIGEIRNAKSSTTINLTSKRERTSASTASVGGIAGINNNGILNYCQNDSLINLAEINDLDVGGVIGNNNGGIIDTVIDRGKISVVNAEKIDAASIIGRTEKGLLKHIMATTEIDIDNSSLTNSELNLGLGVVFESGDKLTFTYEPEFEGDEGESISFYQTNNSPMFEGILVGGKNSVKTHSKANYKYDLGLRDIYKVLVEDESGTAIGVENKLPALFSELYRLSNYELTETVVVTNAGATTSTSTEIPFACAVDNGSNKVAEAADSVVYRPDWFATHIGFNYGINHKEVDLSGLSMEKKDQSLSTINFVLDEKTATKAYFEGKQYNGELSYYDSIIENVYYYAQDEKYSTQDELFSLLYSFISKNNNEIKYFLMTEDYFKVDPNFFEDMEGGEGEAGSTDVNQLLPSYFAEYLNRMFASIYDTFQIELITDQGIVYSPDTNPDHLMQGENCVRKIKCSYVLNNKTYYFVVDLGLTVDEDNLFKVSYNYPNILDSSSSVIKSKPFFMLQIYYADENANKII